MLQPLLPAFLLLPTLLQESTPPPAPVGWTQVELERIAAEIGAEVAELCGREFRSKVAVRITDLAGFEQYAQQRGERFEGADDPQSAEAITKLLGLVAPDFALEKELGELTVSQLGGFYDPGSDTFFLMEQFGGPTAKAILAHELTHALDDQHFDLDEVIESRLGAGSDALFAVRAVIEGSGTRGGTLWTLRNLAEVTAASSGEATGLGTEELSTAPPFLWKQMMGAYLQGQAFLMAGQEGDDTVRWAFEDPPRSSEQILHPEKYWTEERDEPLEIAIDLARPPEGWTVLGQDTLGELVLAMACTPLAERTGLDASNPAAIATIRYTNEAASGWGGDRLVLLGRGEERRLQLVSAWDSEHDAREFAAAIEASLREAIPADRPRSGPDWRPTQTPTAFRVTSGAGTDDFAARTVVVTVASSAKASAEEVQAWLAEESLLAWTVRAPSPR